ncbi:FAD-binding oxidoreductase [Parahaliea maris]|uniref:FAD-binding oxidoreductase n=1 Tax=Parahaliea maris TaxID=2716870 RepID=A0A5C8ZWZ9_9GAMM|nr:FAD-binding oxidoreductase [Parahaliea maris]TXS92007.1 FAD-binding oxidoreductase [Parahaliea maris]
MSHAIPTAELLQRLAAGIGDEHVLTDEHSRQLYAQDVYATGKPALAVVRPGSTGELGEVVRLATEAGYAILPRGGGMSYTGGYLPVEDNTVIVDYARMSRVLEINREDMYVTVECGCTWKVLHEALKDSGLRTPYWGTLSGIYATVGGSLSQNAIFWGSGQFGSAADSVIGLEVVLADGSVVRTGAGAQVNGSPFFRHYGPDLTGLFTCDAGALGFKAVATLRLIPELPAREYVAVDFKSGDDALAAMSEIGRKGLAMECFGFDPFLQAQRMKRESLAADVKSLAGVMKASGSLLGALKDGAKVALAGRRYMDDVDFSVQVIIEERCAEAARLMAEEVRRIIARYNGKEIENSIPKIVRANPFGPVNNMVGPDGERWVPVHSILPHSKVLPAFKGVEAIAERHAEAIAKYGIGMGYLFATISTNAFALEPVFFWPEELNDLHRQSVTPEHLSRLKGFPANPEATEAVAQLRREIVDLFTEIGGVHLQIGKTYRYREGLDPNTFKLVNAIKGLVDPSHKVNPGSLGL